jgi:hypothetical protein
VFDACAYISDNDRKYHEQSDESRDKPSLQPYKRQNNKRGNGNRTYNGHERREDRISDAGNTAKRGDKYTDSTSGCVSKQNTQKRRYNRKPELPLQTQGTQYMEYGGR